MQKQEVVTRSAFRRQVNVRWPLLTMEDLERIEADPEALTDCVQDVYQISSDDADLQVHTFEVMGGVPDFEAAPRPRVNTWIRY